MRPTLPLPSILKTTKKAEGWRRCQKHLTAGLAAMVLCFSGKPLPAETEAPLPGLSAGSGGGLLLEGKPWRGLGVNYYDAFARLLGDGKIEEVASGFDALRKAKIPFVRFAACGYWPVDWRLYQSDREEYFRRLDSLVKIAEERGIGLIPSLFWHQPTISDLAGEPVQAWGNPASKTTAFMRNYTHEVVLRYRGSKAVWAWEFGNEFNLPADLPNAAEHRAPVVPGAGTAATRSASDDLRHTDFRHALSEFANEVRQHDPARLIISGNAFPRPSAWHQMHGRGWEKDSPEQWTEMLAGDNPVPLPCFSGRLYSEGDLELLPGAAALSVRDNKPLIIGEFGVPGVLTEESRRKFRQQLEALEKNRVPLAALWVFDFKGQDLDWNVTFTNGRAEQLRLIIEMNTKWQAAVSAAKPQ